MKMRAAAAALTLGCSVFSSEGACTLIGCHDGLIVRVPGVEGAASIELREPGRDPVTLSCEGAFCGHGVQFEDRTPANATVVVTAGTRVATVDVEPEYTTSRPNGEGCDPECRQAAVTVSLPAE